MKLLSKEASLTVQHELHMTTHPDKFDVALASTSKGNSSTFHFMMNYGEVDSSLLFMMAARNAERLGHAMTPERKFYIYNYRYVALRLSEDEDGFYKLLICADMNVLDLIKRPVSVYGIKPYIGSTVLEPKALLEPFSHQAVLRYTREPIMPEELVMGAVYDSAIAKTRYVLVGVVDDGATCVLREAYNDGKTAFNTFSTRTSAFVKWINGDPDHARG